MIQSHETRLCLMRIVFFLGSVVCATAAQAEETDVSQGLRKFLTKGYAAGSLPLGNCRLSMETKTRTHPKVIQERGENKIPKVIKATSEYVRQGSRQRLATDSVDQDGPRKEVPRNQLWVHDGARFLQYMTTAGSGDTETTRGRASIRPADEVPPRRVIGKTTSGVANLSGHELGIGVPEAL